MKSKFGSGLFGSVFIAGSASSGSKTVRFPVPGSISMFSEFICTGAGLLKPKYDSISRGPH